MGFYSVAEEVVTKLVLNRAYSPNIRRERISLAGRGVQVPDHVRDLLKNQKVSWTPVNSPFEKQIHKAQFKYIAREMYLWIFPPDTPEANILKRIGHSPLNKTRFQKFQKKTRHEQARAILFAFYNRKSAVSWWHIFSQLIRHMTDSEDVLKFAYRLAQLLYGAMHPPTMPTLPMNYRSTDVIGMLKSIRKEESFGLAPILADALSDTGFPDGDLLGRLRDPDMAFSLGDWLFKTTGVLEMHNAASSSSPSVEVPPDGD